MDNEGYINQIKTRMSEAEGFLEDAKSLLLLETKGLSEEELMKIDSANMSGFVGLNEINNKK